MHRSKAHPTGSRFRKGMGHSPSSKTRLALSCRQKKKGNTKNRQRKETEAKSCERAGKEHYRTRTPKEERRTVKLCINITYIIQQISAVTPLHERGTENSRREWVWLVEGRGKRPTSFLPFVQSKKGHCKVAHISSDFQACLPQQHDQSLL